jgi:hypothetical protein
MKRSISCAGLIVGALSLASTGCQQTDPKEAVQQTKMADPTSWSDKDVAKGDSDSATAVLPKSSGRTGSWSSEAQAVERSLGFGR